MDAQQLRAWLDGDRHDVRRADLSAADVAQAGERAGWRAVRLSTPPAGNKAGLLRDVQAAFGWPAHFGHNWDALADSLRDVQPPEGGRGVLLVWTGSDHLSERDRAVMLDILAERCALRPDFAVILSQD